MNYYLISTFSIRGQYQKAVSKGLNQASWRKWLGFAFEYWCLKSATKIAEVLGFSDVEYKVGSFYNRASEKTQKGFSWIKLPSKKTIQKILIRAYGAKPEL